MDKPSLLGSTYLKSDEYGFPVHVFRRAGAPIYVRLSFRAGAFVEAKPGVAHMTEHMLVAGTERFPTKDELVGRLEAVGGRILLTTTLDAIAINFEVPSIEDLPIVEEILSQMLDHSLFLPTTFEHEKGSVYAELARKMQPKEFVWELHKRLFYQGTAAERPVMGTVEDVRGITLDDILRHKALMDSRSLRSIVVSGDVGIEDLGSLCRIVRKSADESQPMEIAMEASKRFDFEERQTDQVQFIAGVRKRPGSLMDLACGDIVAHYLGGARTGFFIRKLRYETGLVYSVSVHNEARPGRGSLVVVTDFKAESAQAFSDAFMAAWREFLGKGIPADKTVFIREYLAKALAVRLQTSEAWVQANERWLEAVPGSTIADYADTLSRITPEDIKRYVEHTFATAPLLVGTIGPASVRELLEHRFQ